MNNDQESPRVNIDGMIKASKRNVEAYTQFVKHAPKLLRQSMMLAYQTAVDDMFKAMDANRTINPVIHEQKPKVVLLDEHGNAT